MATNQDKLRQHDWESIIEPWRLAIEKLRRQLERDCLKQPPDNRRFQNRRLIKNFYDEYKASPVTKRSTLLSYWFFCGSPWARDLPYREARQQHYAELKEFRLPQEFDPAEFQGKANKAKIAKEFSFRLDSLASWLEAQESWIFWRLLNNSPGVWKRQDPQARQKAIDANIIARMPRIANEMPDWMIVDFVKGFRKWKGSDWTKILRAAAHGTNAAKGDDLKLETWVWWRYPIFSRYRWSTAEVCRAAKERFGRIHHVDHEAAFQLFWVRRGLRFTGRRTRRRERPPLWDFVINKELPTRISLRYPVLTRTSYDARPSQS